VEVLGINQVGSESSNDLMVSSRTLPWLQDTAEQSVRTKWTATYRDVRIIDSLGRIADVYNLTTHDLSNPTNRTTLKQMFLAFAKAVDSDHDGLRDDWERVHFGDLSAKPFDDPDHDGFDNRTELAYGTDPLDPKSCPLLSVARRAKGSTVYADVTFRRPAGAWLGYGIDQSADLSQWQDNSAAVSALLQSRNLFDGTGCLEVIYPVPAGGPLGFFLWRALPRP
jgi:hypothetical protein